MEYDMLMIQGPHKVWKLVTAGDNFLPPLGQLAIAAFLIKYGYKIKAIDCCIHRWGWKTTEKILRKINPPIMGVSGPITWGEENLRLCRMMKSINPECITIYGGPFVSLFAQSVIFPGSPVDFVVIGEGEYTMLELMEEFKKQKENQDFTKIKGLAFLKNNQIIYTEPRPMVQNLDDLPMPAYDLLPIEKYGQKDGLWANGVTVFHSKGCIDSCDFCSCWRAMGNIKSISPTGEMSITPKWRTKSVDKTLQELTYIRDKWKKQTFVFTDDTWNVNPKWNEEFAEKYYRDYGLDTDWFAFMRADFIYRDIKNGIFKKLYNSSLKHIIVGVERCNQEGLNSVGKNVRALMNEYSLRWIRENCADLFIQGTFINGLWQDTKETIMDNMKWAKKLEIDYPAFHTITPFPGTKLYDWYKNKGIIDPKVQWEKFEFDYAFVPTKYLTKEQVARANKMANMKYAADPTYILKGLFLRGNTRRRMYALFLKRMVRLVVDGLLEFKNPFELDPERARQTYLFNMVEPAWYKS